MAPISLQPPAYLGKDIFPLNESHMIELQRYADIIKGSQTALKSGVSMLSIFDLLRNIMKIIGDAIGHSVDFLSNTLPVIFSIAHDIVDYAKDAKTVYKRIFDAIQKLDNRQLAASEVQKLQKELKQLIDDEVKKMEAMVVKGDKVVSGLAKFEREISDDAIRLEREIKAYLASLPGYVRDINAEIQKLRDLINPAIRTIQLMQGSFGAISDDLKFVKKQVDENVREAKAIIADIQIDSVLEKWESLGKRAEQYLIIVEK